MKEAAKKVLVDSPLVKTLSPPPPPSLGLVVKITATNLKEKKNIHISGQPLTPTPLSGLSTTTFHSGRTTKRGGGAKRVYH